MFASGSTIWCCTGIEVVKATNPNRQINQGEFVSTISSVEDLRFASRLSDQSSSNHNQTKKNTLVILQPEISHTNKFDIKTQISVQKKVSIPILQNNCSGSKIVLTTSEPVQNVIVSKREQNAPQSHHLECSDFAIPNRELPPKPIQITQNQEPSPPSAPANAEKDPPPLESKPTDFSAPSPEEIEQKLDSLEDERSKRLERLLQRLEENENKQEQQSFNSELGTIRLLEVPMEAPKPPEQKQPPSIEKPVTNFKPVGYLLGHVGYFHTSNIFSSGTNAIDDGLIFSGLTLAAAPFKIAPRTYLNGSIDGNIIRYSEQSEFDYNQVRFNLSVYQQLNSKMYGEIGWNNQQLFYSKHSNRFNFASGDKFLNENSFRLSVGRRDALAPKLNLDSFYEFRLSMTNPPENRNRITNYVWLSLNYYLQQSLRVGIDYQFNLSSFLERTREDQYHRISANLKYGISELSSVNLQSGFTLGGSTDHDIDFDGWFFSVNYSWDLGQF